MKTTDQAGEVALFSLQRIGFTDKTIAGTLAAGTIAQEGDKLFGVAESVARFDGIFGAFYEGYWRRYTRVSDLFLSFRLSGRVEIVIERHHSTSGRDGEIVRCLMTSQGGEVRVSVPLGPVDETRLVLTIRFLEDSALGAMSWATTSSAQQSIHLVAVICTFNREEDLRGTLAELCQCRDWLEKVIVVNQGRAGLVDRLHDEGRIINADFVRVIEQENLGGAGGFGRGILECLSEKHCSHILLMDDDIELDPAVIERVRVALSYMTGAHALGGAMIDRLDRRSLFSVGDKLHSKKPEIFNLVDPEANDISEDATSRYLSRFHQPDFNGWWFYAFPKSAVANLGMPLPLFIRGDDVEYGYRLTRSGLATVSWPGLAVWHIPFHLKRHPWHYFYDRRNSLFLCEMHNRIGRFRMTGFLITGFLNHLLRYDYRRAACVTLGLRAFNDGAGALSRWNGVDHAHLVAAFSSEELGATAVTLSRVRTSRLPSVVLSVSRLIRDLIARSSPRRDAVDLSSDDWRPRIRRRPRSVRVHYADAGTIARYTHDRSRTRECVKHFSIELGRYLRRPWDPQRLASLTSGGFWERYLGR